MKFLKSLKLNLLIKRAKWSASPLLTKEEFRAIIWHECARCDRNNHEFSMVLIDIGNHNNGRTVNRLMLSIIRRMRSTDVLGWFDDNRIGVFLPETDNQGAETFAGDLLDKDNEHGIYTYPSSLPHEMIREHPDNTGSDSDNRRQGGDGAGKILPRRGSDKEASAGSNVKTDVHNIETTEPLYEILMGKAIPIWKRSFDLTGSLIGLIILSPVFAIVAAYIKIVSPGPVFFKQERVGYLGGLFTMWKFRTMKVDTDTQVHQEHLKRVISNDTAMIKLDAKKDSRHILLAGILRKTCIDELPQLINVLKGEMSLIGPRPCLAYEAQEFNLWHNRRFHALPGMTGLWQVSGKNRTTFTEMMRLDVRYSQSSSFMADFVILVKTFPVLIREALQVATRKVVTDSNMAVSKRTRWGRALSSLIRQMFL